MIKTSFISHFDASVEGDKEMRVERNKKGGAVAAYAVYTNAPTQPLNAQASGLCIARGKRNTHGVRTNG